LEEKQRKQTSDLCFGKEVTIQKTGIDRYGRMLAYVYVGDLCVNKQLLKIGLAWQYKKYNKDQELADFEKDAQEKMVGLWSQPNPEAPWNFRKKSH
jgi:micrococcal nuclease